MDIDYHCFGIVVKWRSSIFLVCFVINPSTACQNSSIYFLLKLNIRFEWKEGSTLIWLALYLKAVSREIRNILKRRAASFNIELDDVSITSLTFSREFTAAIEAKQIAAQKVWEGKIWSGNSWKE